MKRKTIWIVYSVMLSLLSMAPAQALEVGAGNLKLVLYEDTGRFNVYYRVPGSPDSAPLLSARDPASSVLSVVIGNTIRTVGGNAEFEQRTEATPLGARFIWTSADVRIIQEFRFISEGGIKITLQLENVSERDLAVGVGILFDTWLGEKGAFHFRTNKTPRISKETVIAAGERVAYWESADFFGGGGAALKVLTAAPDATAPDRIVFANWKRLYENMWDFRTAEGQSFSVYPYSLNDSAVGQFYDPVTVKKGDYREITLVLGNAASPLTASELSGTVIKEATGPTDGKTAGDNGDFTVTMEKIGILNNLLAEIDEKLKRGESFSGADYEQLKTLIIEIKKNPLQKFENVQILVKILNNLLEEINAVISSGRSSPDDVAILNEIIKLLESGDKE